MTGTNAHFRSVLRGYDPAQVDQHVHELAQAAQVARQEAAERTIQVSKLEATHGQLQKEVDRHLRRAQALEEEQLKASAPTYATLGERIGAILTMADEEANEMRARGQADAASHHALADESAVATRRDADRYATEMRSSADSEAAQLMENARRQSDSLLDDADRQAMARLEEAEAVYERARAKSATAAVDFETTLAARRDSSALEFAAEVSAAEQRLDTVRLQAEQTHLESEQAQQEAATRSAQQLEQAMTQAHALVTEAKSKAERIRGDSERELAAATQRRDSINAQLSNVRQMLSALGGVTIANPLESTDAPAAQQKTAVAAVVAAAAEEGPAIDATAQGDKDLTPADNTSAEPADTSAGSTQDTSDTSDTSGKSAERKADGQETETIENVGTKS